MSRVYRVKDIAYVTFGMTGAGERAHSLTNITAPGSKNWFRTDCGDYAQKVGRIDDRLVCRRCLPRAVRYSREMDVERGIIEATFL